MNLFAVGCLIVITVVHIYTILCKSVVRPLHSSYKVDEVVRRSDIPRPLEREFIVWFDRKDRNIVFANGYDVSLLKELPEQGESHPEDLCSRIPRKVIAKHVFKCYDHYRVIVLYEVSRST